MSERDRTLILLQPVLLSCFLLVPSLTTDCRCERSTWWGQERTFFCVWREPCQVPWGGSAGSSVSGGGRVLSETLRLASCCDLELPWAPLPRLFEKPSSTASYHLSDSQEGQKGLNAGTELCHPTAGLCFGMITCHVLHEIQRQKR